MDKARVPLGRRGKRDGVEEGNHLILFRSGVYNGHSFIAAELLISEFCPHATRPRKGKRHARMNRPQQEALQMANERVKKCSSGQVKTTMRCLQNHQDPKD